MPYNTTTATFNLINVGVSPNDGTGDDLRTAFIKVNGNFSNMAGVGTTVGNLVTLGDLTLYGNLDVRGNKNILNEFVYANLLVTDNTPSISTTTGALIVTGGVGVGGNIFANMMHSDFYGNIMTNAQPYITSVGSLTGLTTNNVHSGVVYANVTQSNVANAFVTGFSTDGSIIAGGNLYLGGGLLTDYGVGANGQYLVSTGSGIIWSNLATQGNIATGLSRVSVAELYVNVVIDSTTVATFASSYLNLYNLNVSTSGNINVNGVIANTLTGTLLTAAQPNITSVGTLNGLSVSSNITPSTSGINLGNSTNFWSNVISANIYGNIRTASQPYITSLGNLISLDVTGNVTSNSLNSIYISSTIITASQPYITAVGTLSNLNVQGDIVSQSNLSITSGVPSVSSTTGALLVTGGIGVSNDVSVSGNIVAYSTLTGSNIVGNTATLSYAVVNTSANIANLNVDGSLTVNSLGLETAIINLAPTGIGNIGSPTDYFNTVYALATSAQWGDLAENYLSDEEYPPGTVVVFGGEQEITTTELLADSAVAGVISTNPAYIMNSKLRTGLPVALRGRVPVFVQGKVRKGDLLVTGPVPGVAVSVGKSREYGSAVFAKAIENKTFDEIGTIEAVII